MAKKKTETLEQLESKVEGGILNKLKNKLEKEKILSIGKYDHIQIKKSTGFDTLDAILAGSDESRGFQLRTFNTFFGNSGSGKTTILLQIADRFIRDTESGSIVFLDAEGTTNVEKMKKIGIDFSRILHYNTDLTVESFYQMIDQLVELRAEELDEKGEDYIMENPFIVIVDSFSALASKTEIAASTNVASAMGNVAKIHSTCLKKLAGLFIKYNITVLGIIQIRDNVQIGPTPKAKDLLFMKNDISLSGGKALQFFSFYMASIRSKKEVDESYGFKGFEAEFKMVKSKTSSANKPITLIMNQVEGYSNLWTNYRLLIDDKVIQIKGAYKYLEGYEKNWLTKDLEKLYNTDEDFRVVFDKTVNEHLRSIIDFSKHNPVSSLESLESLENENLEDGC